MSDRRWHVADWGPLGWAESALKLAALVVAFTAAARTWGDPVAVAGGRQWVVVVLLGLATLGLVGAIADRLAEREAIAMAFVLVNVAGHAAALVAARRADWPEGALGVFATLMFVGELVKLRFLTTSGFRVRDISPRLVVGLTGAYALLYATVALLAFVG